MESTDRRSFLQSLVAAGAPIKRTRKRVPESHGADVRIYHGPMTIPAHVTEAVREDPSPLRASGRGTHLVSRYAAADGTVWLFRCGIPVHRGMVGEIVRTPLGRYRVHCWSAATPTESYCEPQEIIAAYAVPRSMPIQPPLINATPSWKDLPLPHGRTKQTLPTITHTG